MSQIENKSGLLIGGGVFAAIVASLCCVGPLLLTILGVSGAAALAKLDVLRIPMIIAVIALFGVAGFFLYQKRKVCEPGSICADPKKFKKMAVAYWIGLALAIVGITSPQWVVWIFG
ncbi:MAG: mercury transporter [Bdellovibrionales bacterium CG11_big_fil_rev_8_21_14_0_20_38_13]|nr:MAG: mercury transporter [Bdellovibrionales bacterium CG11_big_fil_rev_8_21_14_0_20_38_13]